MRAFALVAIEMLAACAGNGGASNRALPGSAFAAPRTAGWGKIQHVVILVQENRSVDNLFQGFPGADTHAYGYDSQGKKIALRPVGLENWWDIDHSSTSFLAACNGTGKFPGTGCRMNGFNSEEIGCGSACPDGMYAYVPHAETAPYFAIGEQYVMADRMFASNFDASSFISHRYIVAGQPGDSAVDFPTGIWSCGGGKNDVIPTLGPQRAVGPPYRPVCWDGATLGDEADAAGISWAYYTSSLSQGGGLWSAYAAIRHVRYGPDWKADVRAPQSRFFSDVSHGNLAQLVWITPTLANSDHAGSASKTGPSWVANVVNAIGTSPYWNSTAIFIFWDDYGGWYDHVAPRKLDDDGLGLRLPLLIVSPYAKRGYVSHVPYEHGSILKFAEDQFGLPRLGVSDARATSPQADAFDFSTPPRPFVPIAAPLDRSYFLHQPLDRRPVDTE